MTSFSSTRRISSLIVLLNDRVADFYTKAGEFCKITVPLFVRSRR